MHPIDRRRSLKAAAAALLLSAAAAGLGACTSDQTHEYLSHSDRVTSGTGDAVADNRATHTIDPWPSHSHKTEIGMDGKRAAVAGKRYDTNTTLKPQGTGIDTGPVNGGQKN
jgi:hypothetical protein